MALLGVVHVVGVWFAADASAMSPYWPPPVFTTCPVGTLRDVTDHGVDAASPDVSAALEAAIAGAALDGEIAYLPAGTYAVASPVHVVAGAILCGAGSEWTTLSTSTDDGAWDEPDAAIELIGADGAGVYDLTVDARGDERFTTAQALSFSLLVSNTHGATVSNVVFRDPGHAASLPSAPALMMLARDAGDAPWFERSGRHVGEVGGIDGVVVEHCAFTLGAGANDWFAIRMNSAFGRTATGYVNSNARNTIRDNTFTGDFVWNTVEIAGAGSYGHVVENNRFDGLTLAHVDLDKGTYANRVEGNTVTRGGRPTALFTTDLVGYVPDVAAFADHGADDTVRNFDNAFVGNVVTSMALVPPAVFDPALLTDDAGFMVAYADGTVIEDARVDDVYGGVYGSGVVLHHGSVGARIERVTVGDPLAAPRSVAYGIRTGFGALGVEGVDVSLNAVYVGATSYSLLGAASPGWSFYGNYADTTSASLSNVVLAGLDAPWVSTNTTVGGSNGFYLDAPGAIATSNLSGAAASFTWAIAAPATLTNNTASGAGHAGAPFPHCQAAPGLVSASGNTFACP